MNIVIAGFGVAGATAAEAARKENPKAYITLFSKEKDLFYYRTRLPEVVSGKLNPEKIYAHPLSWYEERSIEVRLGESLAEINVEGKMIRGSIGSRQNYDKLLLAMGAESNRPSYPGDKLDGIYAVRSLPDAWNMSIYAKGKTQAVLIGGGLLGLEMGYALTKLGLKVTVLERGDRVLPRQTTQASAELLRKKLSALGLDFELNSEAERFEGTRKVENVVLKDGRDLPADIVLISAGIRPNLTLAKALNLKTEQAIVVDEFLETSQPDIYAAGDCIQFPSDVPGLWSTARAQALVAGANLAIKNPNERKKYVPSPPSNILKVAEIDLIAAGNLDPQGELTGIEAASDAAYRKIVLDGEGRLVGFTNVGTTSGNRELNVALAEKRIINPQAVKGLGALDFDFIGL